MQFKYHKCIVVCHIWLNLYLPVSNATYISEETNKCESDPCVNGQCIDIGDGYYCNCGIGYRGLNCEAIDSGFVAFIILIINKISNVFCF